MEIKNLLILFTLVITVIILLNCKHNTKFNISDYNNKYLTLDSGSFTIGGVRGKKFLLGDLGRNSSLLNCTMITDTVFNVDTTIVLSISNHDTIEKTYYGSGYFRLKDNKPSAIHLNINQK